LLGFEKILPMFHEIEQTSKNVTQIGKKNHNFFCIFQTEIENKVLFSVFPNVLLSDFSSFTFTKRLIHINQKKFFSSIPRLKLFPRSSIFWTDQLWTYQLWTYQLWTDQLLLSCSGQINFCLVVLDRSS
jgi:hypothetical protein